MEDSKNILAEKIKRGYCISAYFFISLISSLFGYFYFKSLSEILYFSLMCLSTSIFFFVLTYKRKTKKEIIKVFEIKDKFGRDK